MKKIMMLFLAFQVLGCGELQQVVNQLPQSMPELSNADIANGLRQALDKGIEKQVSKLTQENGFYSNELVKILLPDDLKKVDKTLRDIGLSKLADEGLKILNRAAEEAVSEATPVFTKAVKEITFDDAKTILLGNDNAATNYLIQTTKEQLYDKFNPIVKSSFQKVGADEIWNTLISKYNSIPLIKKVNPNLTDYVTNEALTGVYTMIEVEEKEIRTKISSRSTELLQRVFRLQD